MIQSSSFFMLYCILIDKHEDRGFFERLTYLEHEYPGIGVLLHKRGWLPEEFQKLWTDDRLLNIVEQIIGPEIAGHPVWNLRCKVHEKKLL